MSKPKDLSLIRKGVSTETSPSLASGAGASGSLKLPKSVASGLELRTPSGRIVNERTPVELVFVLDTTGSMTDKIEALIATCQELVNAISAEQLRYIGSVIAFGDLTVPGDRIVVNDFAADAQALKAMISAVPRFGGGRNEGESAFDAVAALSKLQHTEGAPRVAILITDEPTLRPHLLSQLVATCKERETIVFCISPDVDYYRVLADQTGGQWENISSSASLEAAKARLLALAGRLKKLVGAIYHPQLGAGSVKKYLELKDRN